MTYMVIDLETTVKNRKGSHSASPWCEDNYVVAAGYITGGRGVATYKREGVRDFHVPGPDDVAVGHNLKFDIHYLRRFSPAWSLWLKDGCVWDTMLAEHLLTGQLVKYPSLDHCAAKYGGTLKDKLISEYWANGVQTEDIPKEQLLEYLKNDVRNTERVYLAQRERAEKLGMGALIWANMEALLATADMEWNGMCFDVAGARSAAEALGAQLVDIQASIEERFSIYLPDGSAAVRAGSRDQLSQVLFGGSVPVILDALVRDEAGNSVLYKTGVRKGEPKTRRERTTRYIEGLLKPKDTWATAKPGIYQVNDGVLATLRDNPRAGKLVNLVLQYRALEKDISTYYRGYADLTWQDGCIHPSLEHTSTSTGRLSCRAPNLQNTTVGD